MFPIFLRVPWLHATAMTLWFLVVYKGEINARTKRHETIHFHQWNELLVIGFAVIYGADFTKAYVQLVALMGPLGAFWPAYRCIRLEQEAFAHDEEGDYLSRRERLAWRAFSVQDEVGRQKAKALG